MSYSSSNIFLSDRVLFVILFCFVIYFCKAQDIPQSVADFSNFEKKLKETATQVNSIEADFTQEQFFEVFSEKVVSKGTFSFRKEDKIRLQYISPISYLMIMNGNQLQITSEGKTNVVSLGSNLMMHEMKGMLAACMSGNLTNISNLYDTEYFETSRNYIVHIRPKAKSLRHYITEITITLNKNDMSVNLLRLSQPGNNYTEYIFTNQKFNTLTNDKKFIIG